MKIEVEHGKMTLKMLQLKRDRKKRRNKQEKYTNDNSGAHDNFIVNDDIEDEISSTKFFLFEIFWLFSFYFVFCGTKCYMLFWIVDWNVSYVRQDALYIQQLALILSAQVLIAASC